MKKKLQKLLKNQKGLTLVELLAVVVILGIIAAIAVPSIANIIDNSKKDAHIANAEQLVGAARLAVAANDKKLWGTDNSATAGQITMQELVDGGYLEAAIEDPDNNDETPSYETAYVDIKTANDNKGKVTYEVYLKGDERSVAKSSTAKTTAVAPSDLTRDNVVNN
ncbi:prepilin-type N-terminal cleavage/methylation domain-containing protein [Bacillus sp. JJ634]